MNMQSKFANFCRKLGEEIGIGRVGLRRDWGKLEKLVKESVLPNMAPQEVYELLGKEASRLEGESNDLKALAAFGVARGWLDRESLREALQAADESNPLWFLANVSGKTFGGTVAPKLAEFWLCKDGDEWKRRKDVEYYDYDWYVAELESTVRLELKASSEKNPRFQQIRAPRMSGIQEGYDYDGCLCLGTYGGKVEWWYFPASAVEKLIKAGVITAQHGAHKIVSGTYWITMNSKTREVVQRYSVPSEKLRDRILRKHA